jgi:EEF1A lysine methyltransferase 2
MDGMNLKYYGATIVPSLSLIKTPAMEPNIEDLPESRLGTRDYWEDLYQNELVNYSENPEDPGEIWFGSKTETKLVKFISQNFAKSSSILDIGCGNGHLAKRLCELNFSNVTGIDYSESAIDLAKRICPLVSFFQLDILGENRDFPYKFDIIHDKGTFDAISLIPLSEKNKSCTLAEKYSKFLEGCMYPHTKFIITSCNWTRDELLKLFGENWAPDDLYPPIEHSTLSFGGVSGQTVTSIVFKKK